MKKLSEKELKDLENNWKGIIVAVPKITDCDSELYIYGKYINYNDEIEYHRIDYNKEDSFMFSTCELDSFNWILHHFEDYKWFQFDDLIDFSKWYLKEGYNRTNTETKEWITEKCGTNTPPKTAPIRPSIGNKRKNPLKDIKPDEYLIFNGEKYVGYKLTRLERLKEVQQYVQKVMNIHDLKHSYEKTNDERFKEKLEESQKELIEWLSEV